MDIKECSRDTGSYPVEGIKARMVLGMHGDPDGEYPLRSEGHNMVIRSRFESYTGVQESWPSGKAHVSKACESERMREFESL